jgi:hypothetical protein
VSWVRVLRESSVEPRRRRLAARVLDFATADLALPRRPHLHWFRAASDAEYSAAEPWERNARFKYSSDSEAFTDGREIWISYLLEVGLVVEVVLHEAAHCEQVARGHLLGRLWPGYAELQQEADAYAARHAHRFTVYAR